MIMLRLLGILDIVCMLIIVLVDFLPHRIIATFALLLIIKGLMFTIPSPNLNSMADILIGVYIILLSFGLGLWPISLIAIVYLAQKGLVSVI